MMLRSFVVAVTIVGALLAPGVSFAQPSTADKDAAREQYMKGVDAAHRHDYDAARRFFIQSDALVPHPDTRFNLALVEVDSGHLLEALRDLRRVQSDTRAKRETVRDAANLIAKVEQRVGRIRFDLTNKDDTISIDKAPVPEEQRRRVPLEVKDPRRGIIAAEIDVDVMPGRHLVEVAGRTREVDVAAGEIVNVNPPAIPEPPAPTPAPPPNQPDTHAGSGGIRPPPTASWILGVGGIVGLGVGIGFSISGHAKRGDVDDQMAAGACRSTTSDACANARSTNDAANRNALIGVAGLGIGGAALIAGGVVWLLARDKPETQGKTLVVPLMTRDGGGAAVHVSF